VHAGDIGAPEVLAALGELAPVTAVRGNNDHGKWAQAIPLTQAIDVGGVRLYVIHDVAELAVDPAAGGFGGVVAGPSPPPRNDPGDGVLWFNRGSAGPRRFKLPIAVGRLTIESGGARGEIVTLL